jgi:hypothetical protein
MMRGNCGRRPQGGNSALILTAGRWGFWIDRNCRNVLRDNAKWNLEFWGQMTGCLNFRFGKVFEGMDGGLGTRSFGFESHEGLG